MAYKLEHRIGIAAPAEVIWEILADVPGWAAWNPLYPQASGVIRIGETLQLTQALPGQKPEKITPRVVDWVPLEQLHWANSAGGGMVKSLRYIEIEALDESACIFSNGEIFAGLMGPMAAKMLRRPIRAGFAAFSEALKERAEAVYAPMKKARPKKKAPAITLDTLKPIRPVEPVRSMVSFGKTRGKLKSS